MARLIVALCFSILSASHAIAASTLPVVATFSILGDLVKNVGGDKVAVTTLVGADGNTHNYTPKPSDAKKLAAASVIFVNGLDFETWLNRLIDSSGTKATIVTASRGVTAMTIRRPGAKDQPDPHAWQAVENVKIYVANIRDALIAADPAARDAYTANAAAYLRQLDTLDSDNRDALAGIPEAKRRLATPHPSFGYFGNAYGLRFMSLPYLNNEAEASAKDVAAIIETVKRDRVAALFAENASDPRLIRQIASETGVKLGGTLYADALTDANGPAPDYIAMMRHNVREIVTAVRN